jgi:putative ABC transport system substrate-binding protein
MNGRRDFITLLGGAAATWPLAARAQQPAAPLVGFVSMGARDAQRVAAFRSGLAQTGYVDGQNVLVEYHWLEGRFDRLPSEIGDLVRRRAAVIATPGSTAGAQVAKAASSTVPIVFGVADDPVSLGLVASLARPGGNATGVNILSVEIAAKRLALLHELLPKATHVAVLVNPRTAGSEGTLREAIEAAGSLGLKLQVLNAGTGAEIEAAFAALERERADALYLAPDAFFASRRVQLATLAARNRIPTAVPERDMVEAGGLMSYGTDLMDMFRQVGNYVGRILKGDKPTDLPVMQSTKFELVINLQTARALGIEVPPTLIAIADEVIEP